MPKHLKQKFSELLHSNPWWEYKHDIYEKPNGEDGDYYYCLAKGFAIVVPMLPDGRLLLTLQYRYLLQKESIEFPAGDIDTDTDIETAARRELLEETGYGADHMIKLGVVNTDAAMLQNPCHVFLAYVSGEPKQQRLDDTEEIELLTRRPDEFQRMVQNGEIHNGPSLAAWALVQSYLSKQDEDSQFLEAPNVKRLTDKIFGLLDF